MFKVNNKDTLTLNMFHTSCVSIVKCEHVIPGWVIVAEINISFLRNKFDNIDILLIS